MLPGCDPALRERHRAAIVHGRMPSFAVEERQPVDHLVYWLVASGQPSDAPKASGGRIVPMAVLAAQ